MKPEKSPAELKVQKFLSDPTSYDFFQAVRQLQNLSRMNLAALNRNTGNSVFGRPLGGSLSQEGEFVRFCAHASNSFPAGSIQNANTIFRRDRAGKTLKQIEITVNFMGIFGPNGILPRHYTDLAIQMNRLHDLKEPNAYCEFLDLFNNRLIALFYLAWEKYQLPVHQEMKQAGQLNPIEFLIKNLGGLGTKGLTRRFFIKSESQSEVPQQFVSDMFLSKRLARSRPLISIVALQNLVSLVAGVRAHIRCFSGCWIGIPPTEQTRIGSNGAGHSAALGVNATVGSRIWSVQSEYLVELGPVDWKDLDRFLPRNASIPTQPDQNLLTMVRQLLSLKTDPTLVPRIKILTKSDTIRPARLAKASLGLDQPSKLGWNTWLGDSSNGASFDDQSRCKYRNDTEFRL